MFFNFFFSLLLKEYRTKKSFLATTETISKPELVVNNIHIYMESMVLVFWNTGFGNLIQTNNSISILTLKNNQPKPITTAWRALSVAGPTGRIQSENWRVSRRTRTPSSWKTSRAKLRSIVIIENSFSRRGWKSWKNTQENVP